MVALTFGEPKKIQWLGSTEGVYARTSAEPMKVALPLVLSELNLKLHSDFKHVNGTLDVEHGPPGVHVHVAVRPPPGLPRSSECGSTRLPSSSSDLDGVEIIGDSESPNHETVNVAVPTLARDSLALVGLPAPDSLSLVGLPAALEAKKAAFSSTVLDLAAASKHALRKAKRADRRKLNRLSVA